MLNEVAVKSAAAMGPTIMPTACALLASPNAVPRRERATFKAISVFVAGNMAAFSSAVMVNTATKSDTVSLTTKRR